MKTVMNPIGKYQRFPVIELPNRTWPNRQVMHAPMWCSVDLRDGNQALQVPMNITQKITMFEMLVSCGFKHIEVGFPSASDTEFEFIRRLILENRIPDDVTIQVLVPAREDLIKRTVESLSGAKKVIIHLYNSTSPAQRDIVFGLKKPQIIAMAMKGTEWVKKYSASLFGTEVMFQYSPESFSATEVDFSLDVCEAVMDVWQPTPDNKMILNLPCTVEVAMPNVYADQIEWFCTHMTRRDCVWISVHTHNDRGTGVAATELGMLAGADRVEGTLFGNGERTGNLDIVIVALNLYSQGIDPELDFSNIDALRRVYEECTGMHVHERHPYSGDLIFTAFSGTHQDAIRKGLAFRKKETDAGRKVSWNVPYLPVDPSDIGRLYGEVIRVNGQSGKGGVAYLLEQECGVILPQEMLREFGGIAGKKIDALGREVKAKELKEMFWNEYVLRESPYSLAGFSSSSDVSKCTCYAVIMQNGERYNIIGNGNGPINAFVNSLHVGRDVDVQVLSQFEHALGSGSEADAIAYVKLRLPDGEIRWGAGVDANIEIASIKAILSALNRK